MSHRHSDQGVHLGPGKLGKASKDGQDVRIRRGEGCLENRKWKMMELYLERQAGLEGVGGEVAHPRSS